MATYQIVLDERHFCNVNFPPDSARIFAGIPSGNKLFLDADTGKCWLRIVADSGPYDVHIARRLHDITWSYHTDFSVALPNILWQLITLCIINTERYRNGRAIIE